MMFMNMKLIHSYKYTEYATKLHLKPMRLMNETKVIKQIPVGLTIRARITMMGINSTTINKTNNNLPSQLNSLHTKKTMTYCNKHGLESDSSTCVYIYFLINRYKFGLA